MSTLTAIFQEQEHSYYLGIYVYSDGYIDGIGYISDNY